jgi:3-oxoacyl-[acyl-carrier-protein] synthase I
VTAKILGVGMMTAVGVGAPQTAASVRAGVARLSESRFLNEGLDPFVLGFVPEECLPLIDERLGALADLPARDARMLRLASAALREAVAGAAELEDVPLLLALPEPMDGGPAIDAETFLACLSTQAGVAFPRTGSKTFPNGRAAGFLALAEALRLLEVQAARRVIVGGVDTYLDADVLQRLEVARRVPGDDVADGFVPGEGAGFLLLGEGDGVGVVAAAVGTEAGHRDSAEPYRGDGLAKTFQSLFAADGVKAPVQCVLAGLNGEFFGAKEWGVAQVRCAGRFVDDIQVVHPIECFGDPGAAVGPLLLGLGAIGVQKGYLRAPCLVWASSDGEERGAALVHH